MRRWPWLALVAVAIAACSGSDFGKEGKGGQGGSATAGSASGGTTSSTAGNTSAGRAGANSAGSQSQSGAAGNGGRAGANSGGNAGSAGHSAGAGGMVICPPCAAPPAPDCVGSGPCGCGPYTCPSGGATSGEECGPVVCKPPLECCNALMGICTMPGQVCLQ